MRILDSIRGLVLGAIDKLNIWLNPFEEFERDVVSVDTAPLEERADEAWEDIQDNWLHGPEHEFYWHMSHNDLGDMAIWQGFYAATCAFRCDYDALDSAIDGLDRLQYLGGNSRLARGADDVDGEYASDPSRQYYYDGSYIFTDNCSESSLIGYLFGMWAAWTVGVPHDTEVRIARMVNDLAEQVRYDGEVLLNQDGTPAKFGHLRPSLTTAPIRISALACLYLMAEVMGEKLPDEERCLGAGDRYNEIVREHMGALMHPETHFLWIHPWYQDLLAYVVLGIQATLGPADIRARFRKAMRNQFEKNRKEGNPFYTYMVLIANGTVGFGEQDDAIKTLHEFNITNMTERSCHDAGTVNNSQDPSIPKMSWGWFSRRQEYAKQPVPAYKRPPQDIAWQRCPYTLDGGEVFEYNAMDFVLAYHMGRYAGAIP